MARFSSRDRVVYKSRQIMDGPSRNIFVSYSRADIVTVAAIIESLREAGLDVWIDKEGIKGATFWRKEIVDAIGESSVVLFFASLHSCASDNVSKELALASEERKPILPVFIEPVELSAEQRFQVAGVQYIAWYEDRELALKQIVASVENCTSRRVPGSSAKRHHTIPPAPAAPERRIPKVMFAGSAVALLLIVLVVASREFFPASTSANSAPVTNPIAKPDAPTPQAQTPSIPTVVSRIVTNSIGIELVRIDPGTFTMGSDPAEEGHSADEEQHAVTLTRSFYMARTEVTVAQFAKFVNDANYQTDAETNGSAVQWKDQDWTLVAGGSWRHPGFGQGDTHPVVDVSWNDAMEFCEWIGRKEGRHYRLPTEAEWEYCARADVKTAYSWGNNPDDGKGRANFKDMIWLLQSSPDAAFSWPDGYRFTSPVQNFPANAWSLYDMPGNVANWCSDWYGPYPDGAATDPVGPEEDAAQTFGRPPFYPRLAGPQRVVRGGSWASGPRQARLSARSRGVQEAAWSLCGFRVVLDPQS